MPRENSFSDEDGRSLTPDLEDEFIASPITTSPPALPPLQTHAISRTMSPHDPDEVRLSVDPAPSEVPRSAPASLKVRSPIIPSRPSERSHRPTFMTPGDRFRACVRKIIAMRRGSIAISGRRIGAEPGIDPRRDSAYLQYGHIRQKCLIELVDYSSVRSSFGRMTNAEFVRMLADPGASDKESWAKVRWINVGGVSWDVISALAIKYGALPRL